MVAGRGIREAQHTTDLSSESFRRFSAGKTLDPNARHDRRVRTRSDHRKNASRKNGESPTRRLHSVGVQLLWLSLPAETSRLTTTGHDRFGGGRDCASNFSTLGRRTTLLPSDHKTTQ